MAGDKYSLAPELSGLVCISALMLGLISFASDCASSGTQLVEYVYIFMYQVLATFTSSSPSTAPGWPQMLCITAMAMAFKAGHGFDESREPT